MRIVCLFSVGLLCACATQPETADEKTCSDLPSAFHPPFACGIHSKPDTEANLHASEIENRTCFEIEREPNDKGGLRFPRQIVCPSITTTQENRK